MNLGNFLFWGIDALSGAMFKYRPTQYDQELEKSMESATLTPESSSEKESYSTYSIKELRDEKSGEIVLLNDSDNVIVHDSDKGVSYVFE